MQQKLVYYCFLDESQKCGHDICLQYHRNPPLCKNPWFLVISSSKMAISLIAANFLHPLPSFPANELFLFCQFNLLQKKMSLFVANQSGDFFFRLKALCYPLYGNDKIGQKVQPSQPKYIKNFTIYSGESSSATICGCQRGVVFVQFYL